MSAKAVSIEEFLNLSKDFQILDVRSPGEFNHAHIPGALSLPLFSDEERKIVGTTYKQQSREDAIKIGLDFFGPKMKNMVLQVEEILKEKDTKTILVHCWRGGMRSGAVAWLLDLYGFKVYTLKGGYKAFRNWVLTELEKPYRLRILGGFTGSGKTEILHELKKTGEAVIDLEGLACHKGSTFGGLGQPEQPSNEYFENMLAMQLRELTQNENRVIWLEGESSRIGTININHLFFNQMKTGESIHIEVPREDRLNKAVEEYGSFDKLRLIDGVNRISRRLGGQNTKQAIEYLNEGNIKDAFGILLDYYDRFYHKSELFRPFDLDIDLPGTDPIVNSKIILNKLKNEYAD